MDERGLCALYLFHALCAVSTRCDKWVSQSVYGRNTKNFPEQIEIETSSFLVVAVNISISGSVVLGMGDDQPSGSSLQVTYHGCMATSLQQDLQGVSSSDASPVICSAVEALACGLVWRLGLSKPHRDRVELSSRRNYCVINFFYLKFTGHGQNNGNSCEIYTFLY